MERTKLKVRSRVVGHLPSWDLGAVTPFHPQPMPRKTITILRRCKLYRPYPTATKPTTTTYQQQLVDYSERDHFSGDSYRMAFPLASVAVDLMARHAGLSDLFLGTLYS